ncbi:MAG TPA: histone deacetylase [Chryseosolibacter sp.]|nr:histone deacetylase [Chryseosolibacter sp.]
MLKVAWTESYVLPLPPNHRFPMSKYEVLPQQLLHEGTLTSENIFQPSQVDARWVLLTHTRDYFERLQSLSLTAAEIRRTGFPLDKKVVERELHIVNGTLECARYALRYGVAMNIAGGTHHAFTNRGAGFCLLNDIAIAANYLLREKLAKKILVVDLDVHQGDGTAEIFGKEKQVFTFSMHGANNYPMQKEKSDLDIGLPDNTDDKHYLEVLDVILKRLLDQVEPDFIFYQSGVDILATDKLGKLSITRGGCKQRDRLVLRTAHQNGIPLVASMGGGYSEHFRDIIEAHANTFRLAQEIYF